MAYVISQKAARALTRIIRGAADATAPTYRPATISPDSFPPPFTVRWSQSESSGEGAWVIWLPDTSQLVMYDTDYITPSGITATSALPSGWYKISGMQGDAEELWLVAHIPGPDATGSPSAEFSDSEGQATTGESVINLLIAQMETDDDTEAKRVKQYVDSAVVLGGGSGGGESSVTLDNVSTDYNDNDEVQIKDWDTGTPAATTTIAQDINDGNTTAQSAVVSRTTGGALQYKLPGTLSQLLGSSVTFSSKKILTGIRWDTDNLVLVVSSATISVANGVITTWNDNADDTIPTVNISSIIG